MNRCNDGARGAGLMADSDKEDYRSTGNRGAVATEQPPATNSPTVTHYQQMAAEFIKSVDLLTASIPNVQPAHEQSEAYVSHRQNVPDEFLRTVVAAIEQLPELQALNKLDPVEGRDALQFIEAFKPVVDRIAALLRDLRHTVRLRRTLLSNSALQVYGITKLFKRDAGSAAVTSHVENMERDLGRSRPSKRKPATPAGSTPPA
jgi:hypothetical protein